MVVPRPSTTNWTVYAALALTVAGIVYQGGTLSAQISNNDRRISKLEGQMDRINTIDTRTARMEGKLDAQLFGKGEQK